jgi:hypothetical protein
MIYWGEDAERNTCPVCGASRYKSGKKAPQKVLWYFPITPHLQRYFAHPKEAKLMRWHMEKKKPEDAADDDEGDKMLELCPRGNNKDVIIIILVHDNVYIPC